MDRRRRNRKLARAYKAVLLRCFYGLVLLACAGAGLATETAVKKPNIILIVSDNQSPSLLGAYGNSQISTPNIDQLAKQGVLFSNAFATSGVCSPTRATLLTGLLPSQTGVHNALPSDFSKSGHADWSAIEEFRTLPYTLAGLGYKTALIGKYHLGATDKAQLGFDYWLTFASGHTKSFYGVEVIDNGSRYTVAEHLTDFWTQKSVDFINTQDANTPFFLMLSYNGPYILPPVVTESTPNRHWQRYSNDPPSSPQLPVHPFLQNWAMRTAAPTDAMQTESTHAWAAIHALNNRTAMINVAAETSMVDDGVGRVMKALRDKQLQNDTLVVYTSDQGSSYGQHGLWGNTSWAYPFPAYDSHLRIPLIFHHPTGIKGGVRSGEIINQFDLFQTFLDYLGEEDISIENTPGTSFAPVLESQPVSSDRAAFFEFITVRGIHTEKWKYIRRFPDGPHELYDIQADPGETHNLIAGPDMQTTIAKLDRRLTDFFSRYADPKYDLWAGGSAKGRLIEDYGKNHIFSDLFPGWRPPYVEKSERFSD